MFFFSSAKFAGQNNQVFTAYLRHLGNFKLIYTSGAKVRRQPKTERLRNTDFDPHKFVSKCHNPGFTYSTGTVVYNEKSDRQSTLAYAGKGGMGLWGAQAPSWEPEPHPPPPTPPAKWYTNVSTGMKELRRNCLMECCISLYTSTLNALGVLQCAWWPQKCICIFTVQLGEGKVEGGCNEYREAWTVLYIMEGQNMYCPVSTVQT